MVAIQELLFLMKPKACPSPLVRIGGCEDGAYLVPDDLEGIESCFSPGVSNFKKFEDQLALEHGIGSHLCDFSSDEEKFQTPLIDGMQTFEKKWLDVDRASNSIDLDLWVERLSRDHSNDLLLQMDIEGAEYRNLLSASKLTINRFRIIVIELHGLDKIRKGGFRYSVLNILSLIWLYLFGVAPRLRRVFPLRRFIGKISSRKIEPYLLLNLLRKLNSGHVCVHAHPNNCCGEFIEPTTGMNVPCVVELTYLRRDRFLGDSNLWFDPQLPHPADIDWNVSRNPALRLNSKWL